MKKNLSKAIVASLLVMLLLGTAVAGFLALSGKMDEVDYAFDTED